MHQGASEDRREIPDHGDPPRGLPRSMVLGEPGAEPKRLRRLRERHAIREPNRVGAEMARRIGGVEVRLRQQHPRVGGLEQRGEQPSRYRGAVADVDTVDIGILVRRTGDVGELVRQQPGPTSRSEAELRQFVGGAHNVFAPLREAITERHPRVVRTQDQRHHLTRARPQHEPPLGTHRLDHTLLPVHQRVRILNPHLGARGFELETRREVRRLRLNPEPGSIEHGLPVPGHGILEPGTADWIGGLSQGQDHSPVRRGDRPFLRHRSGIPSRQCGTVTARATTPPAALMERLFGLLDEGLRAGGVFLNSSRPRRAASRSPASRPEPLRHR